VHTVGQRADGAHLGQAGGNFPLFKIDVRVRVWALWRTGLQRSAARATVYTGFLTRQCAPSRRRPAQAMQVKLAAAAASWPPSRQTAPRRGAAGGAAGRPPGVSGPRAHLQRPAARLLPAQAPRRPRARLGNAAAEQPRGCCRLRPCRSPAASASRSAGPGHRTQATGAPPALTVAGGDGDRVTATLACARPAGPSAGAPSSSALRARPPLVVPRARGSARARARASTRSPALLHSGAFAKSEARRGTRHWRRRAGACRRVGGGRGARCWRAAGQVGMQVLPQHRQQQRLPLAWGQALPQRRSHGRTPW